MGTSLLTSGDYAQAEDAYLKGLKIWAGLLAREPASAEWQGKLWISYTKIGDLRLARGEPDRAIDAYRAGAAFAKLQAERAAEAELWFAKLRFSKERMQNARLSLPMGRIDVQGTGWDGIYSLHGQGSADDKYRSKYFGETRISRHNGKHYVKQITGDTSPNQTTLKEKRSSMIKACSSGNTIKLVII